MVYLVPVCYPQRPPGKPGCPWCHKTLALGSMRIVPRFFATHQYSDRTLPIGATPRLPAKVVAELVDTTTVTNRSILSYNVAMSAADPWNPAFISNGFLFQAEDADRYLSQVGRKVRISPSYRFIFDEHLARFYVFNYLHGRHFLSSREALLKELKRLSAAPFPAPAEAYDPERFEHFRKQYLAQLISRFGRVERHANG